MHPPLHHPVHHPVHHHAHRPLRRPLHLAGVLAVALSTAAAGPGCARPLPGAALEPAALAAAEAAPLDGPLSFEQALARALAHDPGLSSARAQADGVALPSPGALAASAGTETDRRPEGVLAFDLLALLGQGPARAERVLARLRRDEAGRELAARTREVAEQLALAFAREAALAEPLEAPPALDASGLVQAGLAPAAVQALLEAARAGWAADEAARAAEQLGHALRVGVHVGAPAGTAPALQAPPLGWPAVPGAQAAALLAVHPAVQRRVAAYEVARGEALRAQAARDPGLELSPSLVLDPSTFFGAVQLRLPLGAGDEVRAALARMEAARSAVRAAVLEALAEAHALRAAWQAAEARAVAASARLEAARALAGSERQRMLAGGQGSAEALLATREVLDAHGALRSERLSAAEARVRAAFAAGAAAPGLPLAAPAPTQMPPQAAAPTASPPAEAPPAGDPAR
ncbi:MAG: TolC family protein [Planctomycetia bacterium]